MTLTITIEEQKGGDVAVHIKSSQSYVTLREDRYANEITKSVKDYLAQAMPAIVQRVLAQEKN